MPIKAEVHGVRETVRALERVEADSRDLSRAGAPIGQKVGAGIASRSRKASGDLRRSWAGGVRVTPAGVEVSSDLVYAGVQEYGWRARNIDPTGAIEATLGAEEGNIVELYERELERIIRADT